MEGIRWIRGDWRGSRDVKMEKLGCVMVRSYPCKVLTENDRSDIEPVTP